MTKNIFLVTNSIETSPVAFSNIGSALDFVRHSHEDLNPEGSALMFATASGLVPATNKVVKASYCKTLSFVASAADAAANVAAVQSKLDGALAACELVGIDPANVAMVAALQTQLESIVSEAANISDSVAFEIVSVPLHKRKHSKKSSS